MRKQGKSKVPEDLSEHESGQPTEAMMKPKGQKPKGGSGKVEAEAETHCQLKGEVLSEATWKRTIESD